MTALVYEVLAMVNFALAGFNQFFRHDETAAALDLLAAILMAIMSLKYDKDDE